MLPKADIVKKEFNVERSTFKLAVNYDQPLADMIADGKYYRVNNDITAEHFPLQGSGQQEEVEVELFHFNREMRSEQVITEMDKAGYQPAKSEELLALGAEYPNLQRKFPIFALGSQWRRPRGNRYVLCLHCDGSERNLELCWFKGEWGGHCRFLAFRKQF